MQRIVLRTAESVERGVHKVVGAGLVTVASVGARALGRGKHRDWRKQNEAAAARRAARHRHESA